MKNKFLLVIGLLVILILSTVSCYFEPMVDQQLESQVRSEAQGFELLLSELVKHVDSIKDPGDVDIRTVFPDSWLFEQTSQHYVIGIPVPAQVRGLVRVPETEQWTYYMIVTPYNRHWFSWYGMNIWEWPFPNIVYFNRAGKLNPNTDIYIVPGWTGQPFYWGNIQGGAADKGDYPRSANLDYFKTYKTAVQPYLVPIEATHGVYQEPFIKPAVGSVSNLAAITRQLWDANPYLNKSDIERSKTPPVAQLVSQLSSEADKINNDVISYLNNINNLENKYFIPNSWSYDKLNQLTEYKNSLLLIQAQLSQIDVFLKSLRNWNFANVEKFRALNVVR